MVIIKMLIIFFAFIVVHGCSKYSVQSNFPDEMIERIEPGKTMRAEIIDWFGPPTQLVVENNREQFIYKSCSKKTEDFVPATGVYSDRMLQDAMDGRCEILIIIIDRVSQRVTGIERKFNDNEESSFN